MSRRISPIWEYFEEVTSDETKVFCKVNGCKTKVSRGKTGTSKANLSIAPMMQHLKLKHTKENAEFCKKRFEKKTEAEKRKADEEDDDLDWGWGCPSLESKDNMIRIIDFLPEQFGFETVL